MNLVVLMVLYNKKLKDSITYQKLKSIQKKVSGLTLFIVDNSTDINNKQDLLNTKNACYINMHGNKGLSVAYNKALSIIIPSFSSNDILILLDDDTGVTTEYFLKLKDVALSDSNTDIFVPIIKGQNGVIYSPNKINFFKNKLLKRKNEKIEKGHFNAISSCMAIRLRVFNNYKFDERLFLDNVDQKFCEDQNARGKTFKKLDVVINQNFHQRETKLVAEKLWNRYRLRIRDIIEYGFIKKNMYVLIASLKVFLLNCEFSYKTKSFSFFTKSMKYEFQCLRKRKKSK